MLDARGVSSFALLRKALENGGDGIVCYAFDLLFLDGVDLRAADRWSSASSGSRRCCRAPSSFATVTISLAAAHDLVEHACRLGAEGLIAKRARPALPLRPQHQLG